MFTLPIKYDSLNAVQKRLVREQYAKQQNNLCMFCKHSLSEKPPLNITAKPIHWNLFPKGFLTHPVHLHHCHSTGLTEGAVHSYCNAVLFQYHGK
jgi:hypothetical protein